MTDRELLELAAKAAWEGMSKQMVESGWNPLTDDGDALRLAVKLGLTICNEHESAATVYCTRDGENFPEVQSGNLGDPVDITANDYAATRRAIVRAAAEIGRSML